jgi:hypothetical protein
MMPWIFKAAGTGAAGSRPVTIFLAGSLLLPINQVLLFSEFQFNLIIFFVQTTMFAARSLRAIGHTSWFFCIWHDTLQCLIVMAWRREELFFYFIIFFIFFFLRAVGKAIP